MSALRLMVFDRTCAGPRMLGAPLPGLTWSWKIGARLYRQLGRLDLAFGAASWAEALAWLRTVEARRPIAEIQIWSHGHWGRVLMQGDGLTTSSLAPSHAHHEALTAIRDRLTGPEALWWFRTCETFGRPEGHDFARAWTRFFACRAAGHTHIIGPWQSGLHSLRAGEEPRWSVTEGVREDVPGGTTAAWSGASAPNTITCLHGSIPAGM